jgi:hypothetical protein
MTYSFVKSSANNQTVEETQLVMTYELGGLFECLYIDKDDRGYKSFAQSELADYISMCRMLCEQVAWDFDAMANNDNSLRPATRQIVLARMMMSMSKMVRGLHYLKRFGAPKDRNPQEYMHKLIQEVQHLCLYMDLSFEEICTLGEQRYEERMHDLHTIGIKSQLKKELQ